MATLPLPEGVFTLTELGDEFLAYQKKTEQAHCLSPIGGLVLKGCLQRLDRSVVLQQLAGLPSVVDAESALDQTLAMFQEKGILAGQGSFDRRSFLTAAGALAIIPVLSTVGLPDPAQAASCAICASIAITDSPECADCGLPCRFNAAGDCPGPQQRCCFGYRINSANNGGAECQAEKFGVHTCQFVFPFDGTNNAVANFDPECATIRAVLVGRSAPNGTQYYCCDCPGVNTGAGSIDGINCTKP